MRYVRYALVAVLAVVLITVALANRGVVTLRLLPDTLAGFAGLPLAIDVPLYVVIFAGIVAGLLIGFVWEWLREHKHRAEAARKAREVTAMQRELKHVKGQRDKNKDEVLALLDDVG
jgi:uncharacterized integral membrane protein